MLRLLVRQFTASHTRCTRYSTLVAWGLDDVGQCGLNNTAPCLIPHPTVIDVPSGEDVAATFAGVRSSAMVTTSGDVYTWGYNTAGCLGHGDEEHVRTPRRIEWLAHRAVITNVALGKSHTILLDDTGQAWSCGVDLEGQCGTGASLQHEATQHSAENLAWFRSAHKSISKQLVSLFSRATHKGALAHSMQAPPSMAHAASRGGGSGAALHGITHHMPSRLVDMGELRAMDPVAPHSLLHASLGPLAPPTQQQGGLPYDWEHEHRFPTWVMQRPTSYQRPQGSRTAVFADGASNTHAQQEAVPLPGYPWDAARTRLASDCESDFPGTVIGIAASHYFSLLLGSGGRVWAFGSGFNGELGCEWTRSSVPHPVEADLGRLLEDHGGAVKVVAGSRFAAALTRTNRVVCWGEIPTAPWQQRHPAAPGAVLLAWEGVVDIEAASGHLVATDGQQVWMLGQLHHPHEGAMMGASETCPAVFTRPAAGIVGLAAGRWSVAAITGEGEALLWGSMVPSAMMDLSKHIDAAAPGGM